MHRHHCQYCKYLVALLGLLITTISLAQEPTTTEIIQKEQSKKRPIVGLVLGGGGAKGAAHVGVLRVLEQLRIPIDIIVGTSAGSAVGAMYAMGKSAHDIEETFFSTDWEKGFVDSTPRPDLSIRRKQDQKQFAIDIDLGYRDGQFRIPQGIVQGQRLQILLNEMTLEAATIDDFDQLPIRYRAVATDLETGQEVVLGKGNLALAVRASMSVPGVYTPVEIGGKTLVDGGLSNNVPISVARAMGADVVIVVDLSSPLRSSEDIQSSLAVLEQLSDFMTGLNSANQVSTLGEADIYLKPELGDIGSASFDRVDETIELGAKIAAANAAQLSALSVDEAEFSQYEQRRLTYLAQPPVIQRIRLINESTLYDEILLARIEQQEGEKLDPAQLEQDLGRIYGLGYFETVTYRIESEEDDTKTLVINARGKSWGPNYLRFGIEMEDNFNGISEYGLSSSVLMTKINRYGAEWVNTLKVGTSPSFYSEFYQPLGYAADYFSRSFIQVERYSIGVFSEGESLATYEIREDRIGTEGGIQIGTDADFAAGVYTGGGSADLLVGPVGAPDIDFDTGACYVRLSYDRLDDEFFPSSGQSGILGYFLNRQDVGSDYNYDRLELDMLTAHKFDRLIVNLRLKGSLAPKNKTEALDWFQLGGFLNLSGYTKGELTGQEGALATMRAYYQMSESTRWYLGGSLEAGNVFNEGDSKGIGDFKTSGSLFVAANTFMGPISLAYGYATQDKQALYLNLGRTF